MIKVRVKKNLATNEPMSFSDGNSKISVTRLEKADDGKSIGFQSFKRFGCILAGKEDCE